MTEGFTCYYAEKHHPLDRGIYHNIVLKSTFLFNRGFHQMTVLKSTFLINRGITNRHCFTCSFKNKQSLHCCVCKLITLFFYVAAYSLLHCCAIFFATSTPHCCVYTCTACALFKDKSSVFSGTITLSPLTNLHCCV